MLKKRMLAIIIVSIFTFTIFAGAVGSISNIDSGSEFIMVSEAANYKTVENHVYSETSTLGMLPFVADNNELYVYENFEYLGPGESFPANVRFDRPSGVRTDGVRDFGNNVETLISNGLKAGTPGTDQSVNSSYWTDSDLAVLINKNTLNDNGKITINSHNWESNPISWEINYPVGLELQLPFLKGSGNTVIMGDNARFGRPFIDGVIQSSNDIWFSLLVYLNMDSIPTPLWGTGPEAIGFSIGNDNANWETASPDWDPIFIAAESGVWTVGEAKRQNGSEYKFSDDKYDPIQDSLKREKAALKLKQTQLLIGRATLESNGTVTTRLFIVNAEDDLNTLIESSDVNSLAVAAYNSTNTGRTERPITDFGQLNAFGFWVRSGAYIDDIRIGKTLGAVAPLKKHEIEYVNFKQKSKILGSTDMLSSKEEINVEVKLSNPKARNLDVKLECIFDVPGHDLPVRQEFKSTDLGENLKGFTVPKMSVLFPDNVFPVSVDYIISDISGNTDSDGQREVSRKFNVDRVIEELKVYYGAKEILENDIVSVSRSTDTRERTGLFEITTKPLNPSNDSVDWSGEAVSGGFVSLKSTGQIVSGRASVSANIGKTVVNKPLTLKVGTEVVNFNFNIVHVPVESVVLKDTSGETFDTAKGVVLTDFTPSKSLAAVYSPSDADILDTPLWSITGNSGVINLVQSAERYDISKLEYGVTELTVTVDGKPYRFPVNVPSTITSVTKISFTGGQDNGKFYVQASDAEIDREIRSLVKIEPSDATIQSLTWDVIEGSDVIEITNGEINVLKKGTAKIKATAHNGVSISSEVETIIPISAAGAKNISVMNEKTVRLTIGNLNIEPLIKPEADITEIKYMIDTGEDEEIFSNDRVGIENLGMYSYLTGKMAGVVTLKAVITCKAVDGETGKLIESSTNVSGITLSINIDPEKILLDVIGEGSIDRDRNIIYINRGKSVEVTASFKPDECNAPSINWRFEDYINLGYLGANPYNSYIGSSENINLTNGVISAPLNFIITGRNGGNVPILVLKAGNVENRFTIIEKDPSTNFLEYLSKDTPDIISLAAEGKVGINEDGYIGQALTDWSRRTPMVYYFHCKEDNVPVTLDLDWQPSWNNDKSYTVMFTSYITHYNVDMTMNKETISTRHRDVPKQNNTYTKVSFDQTANRENICFHKGLNVVEVTFDNGMDRHKGLTVKWDEKKPGVILKAFNYIESLSIDSEKLNKDIADKGIISFKPVLKDYLTVIPSNANVDRYNFEIEKVLGKESNVEITDSLSGKLNIKKAGQSRVEITAVAPDTGFSKSISVDIKVPEVNTKSAEICIDSGGLAGTPLNSLNLVPKFLREQAIRVALDENATNTSTKFVVLNSSGVALTVSELKDLGIEISGSGNEAKLKIEDSVTLGNYSIEAQVLDKDGAIVKSVKIPLNISNNYVKVTEIDITEKNHHIRRGQVYKLTSSIYPSNSTNKNVRWELAKPSDSQYVTLFPNGEVMGIKANQSPVIVKMISDDNGLETQTSVSVDPVRISDNLQDEELLLTMGIVTGQTASHASNVYGSTAYRDIVNNFNKYIKAYPYENAVGEPWENNTDFMTLSFKKAINEGLKSMFGINGFADNELPAVDDNSFAYFVENLINGKHTIDASRFYTRFTDLRLSNILSNGSTEPNNTEEFTLRLGPVPEENYEVIGLPVGLNPYLEILKTVDGKYDLFVILNGISAYPIESDLEFTVIFKPVTIGMEGIETENDLRAVSMIYPALEEETELKLRLNCVQTLIPVVSKKDTSIKMAGEYGLSSDHTFSVDISFDNIIDVKRDYDKESSEYAEEYISDNSFEKRPVSIIQGVLPKNVYSVNGLPAGMVIEKAEAVGNTVVFTVVNNSIEPVNEDKDIYVIFEPSIMQTETDTKSASIASKAMYSSRESYAATLVKSRNTTGTTIPGGGGGGGTTAKVEKLVNSQSDIIIETTTKGKAVTANVRLEDVMNEIATKQDSVLALDIRAAALDAVLSVLNFDASLLTAAFDRNNIVKLDSGAAVLTMPVGSSVSSGRMRYSVQNNDYVISISLNDENGEVKFTKPVEISIVYDTKAFLNASNLVLARQNPETKLWEPLEEYSVVSNGVMRGTVTALGNFRVVEKVDNEAENNQPNLEIETGFNDLDSVLWAKDAILFLNEIGIIKGQTATEFAPHENITRAQFAALIVRVLGLGISGSIPEFDDVTSDDWFKTEVDVLSSHGIILGSDKKFRPNDNVTRQEMAAIISRALSLENSGSYSLDFNDKSDIADWAVGAISACTEISILAGMGDNTFAPLENTTRAQAAVVIYRIYNLN